MLVLEKDALSRHTIILILKLGHSGVPDLPAYRGQLLKDISQFKCRYLENSVLEMPETS